MIRTFIHLSMIVFVLSTPGCARSSGADGIEVQPPTRPVLPAAGAGNVDLPRYPSISPDGTQIVFSWRGDLWIVPSVGGTAHRLTSHPGDDLTSAWSPDGQRIAFVSTRTGYPNIHLMNKDGTALRQVTDIDGQCIMTGFGVDEEGDEVITFAAALEGDVYTAPRPYMVRPSGGEIRRVHDAFGSSPVISPDGTRVAFTRGDVIWTRRHYRGANSRDVWLFDRRTDAFTRLTHWAGNDGKARWADSQTLVFLSDRESNCLNLYRMDADKGGKRARQLTKFTEKDVQDFAVSANGAMISFVAWDTLYTLDLTSPDATPVALSIRATEDEFDRQELKKIDREVSEAELSPDGKVMAFVAYGEVYVRSIDKGSPTRRVTRNPAREKEITWSPDGLKLYFVSDRDGTESIYAATVARTRGEIKEDFEKAINPPKEDEPEPEKEEHQEATPPNESDQTADDAAAESPEGDAEEQTEPNGAQEEDDEEATTDDDDAAEKEKEEELPKELKPQRWHDALEFNIEAVIAEETNDREPSIAPDGKSLSFRRGLGDLAIYDFESGETRVLVPGWDAGLHWEWSPDSRHIAYAQSDLNYNTDIWIIPADGSSPAVNITRHPDDDSSPSWSADGKILSFLSERVNDESDVWMVYLDANLEALTPLELEKYYEDAADAAKKRKPLEVKKPEKEEHAETENDADPEENSSSAEDDADDKTANQADDKKPDAEKKDDKSDNEEEEDEDEDEPVELGLDDAYLRLKRVTTLSGFEHDSALSPGGDRYIFTATIGERGLYSVKWDGKDRTRLGEAANVQHVSLTGDKVVFVNHGRAGTVGPGGGAAEYVDISDEILIDLQAQSSQKFREAARALGEAFYDASMKGLDWAKLTEEYHQLARRARTASEFNYVANRFIGELSASHMAVYTHSPKLPNAQPTGTLGTRHRWVGDGYEVVEVTPESPAAKGDMALLPGDVITGIELTPLGETDTIESLLRGRVGQETLVSIRRVLDDGEPHDLNVLLTPISDRQETQLKYNAWRRRKAELAEEWSDGRIGYIHIQAMGQESLDVFERDLYAAAGDKEGLIIDVRSNGGGWTTDRLLASIMAPNHAYTVPRGGDPSQTGSYPQGRLYIQRYTLPINMLCNEQSYSNAEIISHAFKTLNRGTLVGQTTHGSVISTGATLLIDGTWVRLPMRGWHLLDGTDMDNHGAVPDIIVDQTPEAESRDDDEQLRAAVKDLLKRLK